MTELLYNDNNEPSLVSELCEENRLKIIEDYFRSHGLVKHQIDSFNWFINKGLKMIINNEPSIRCENYTLKFNNICVEKPTIIDEDRNIRALYPQEARNKNLSYTANVCVDTIETIESVDGKPPQISEQYRVPIAKIPIMLLSDACHLRFHSADENERCNSHPQHDQGGYFIINGKERVLISQVRKTYNKPLCFIKSTSQKEESLVCEMRSMCEETFHSTEVEVKIVKNKIVVSLKLKGNKVDIPVGIVFKALGFTEDMFDELLDLPEGFSRYVNTIKNNCTEEFDIEDGDEDSDDEENLVKVFRNMSVSADKDGSKDIVTIEDVKKSLDMDLFPHLGITSTKRQRAELLCVMIKKFLFTLTGRLMVDSRDDYNHKRVESAGELCYFLFRLLYKKFQKACVAQIKNRKPDISNFLKTSAITTGMMYSFSSGYWGVQRNTYIRTGVSQVVNPKVSLIANYSSLRRVVIPESKDGKEAKTSELRQIHPSSSFLICPTETPEGKSVGTVLNMALFTAITTGISTCEIMDIINCHNLKCCCEERDERDCFLFLINGTPYGYGHVSEARQINFLNDKNISIAIDTKLKLIEIYSDSGRLIRPVFDLKKIKNIKGPLEYTFAYFIQNQLIKFVDINEVTKNLKIAIEPRDITDNPTIPYDTMELHPFGMMSIVTSTIVFSDRTQSARNCFYTSMVKQAIGFIPSHFLKTETVSHTLNYPQKPLVTTDIAEYNQLNDFPNGINVVIAIACYTGFNQEDSIILNKASIERGLFNTTTYNTFTAEEKKNGIVEEKIEIPPDSIKIRDCNYGLLDHRGVIRARQNVKKGDVLIGKVTTKSKNDVEKLTDSSIVVQSGEDGFVDTIIDTVVDGCRLVKVVISQLRVPEIGDKFCSGMAQKGTCGIIYPQEDMPFTKDGMCPDMIINPNCIPSRMTINQIIATVMSKVCAIDPQPKYKRGNPFSPGSSNILEELCQKLQTCGYEYNGSETMRCGFTGRPIKSQIFMGVVYYHRLKHMVKDKMHARSHGQVTTLHRQPNCGRAQGGGLRFGEMEKDCIIAHGATKFLNERMFSCSDPFEVDVCKDCGNFASTDKKCHVCGSFNVKACNIPYSFKNLIQELNAMGIKTKIDLNT